MPELPDIMLYQRALLRVLQHAALRDIRLVSPFVLRSVEVSPQALIGRVVTHVLRMGKRLILALQDDYYIVIHLMIAGRLQWGPHRDKLARKIVLAAFDFPDGTLQLTEVSKKKRAALHFVQGTAALAAFDRGGLEVLTCTQKQFVTALRRENHTLKRTLTDPRLFSGIGNAYSDEILHRARLSPVRLSQKLSDDECKTLFTATRAVLREWIDRLQQQTGDAFPSKVTAFRPEMAVHGRYRLPCPVCHKPIQRIAYADNETNYCAVCQNGGKLLADRALSRLLKQDWPRTLEDLEELTANYKR